MQRTTAGQLRATVEAGVVDRKDKVPVVGGTLPAIARVDTGEAQHSALT